ncbi:bifunctional methylenetetrahydrofolate dehydrogenase/methenyltetrahydrofolate cyclohydrolase FolD [bacterium]|nr:bifunctional methylenetetrahydrofolate dehydrogenase/methenyltetrahydrofolate cyclohydrolase FolD [bacterium]
MEILDGRKTAKDIRKSIKIKVDELIAQGKRVPGLAVVIVGFDPASESYVKSKEKACKRAGIYSKLIKLESEISQETLLEEINKLNRDENIDGILIQLPLPAHIDPDAVMNCIDPIKDVDGFNFINIGSLCVGKEYLAPCTPKGIIRLLKHYNIELSGKKVCIIGRSNIVGKPLALLFLQENCTVTVCHSRTKNPEFHTLNSDIIVPAVGISKFLKSDMVSEGAIVIDVGINVDSDGKICGDVDYESVAPKCSFITPVPGGVGPMTIALLLENTFIAYRKLISS